MGKSDIPLKKDDDIWDDVDKEEHLLELAIIDQVSDEDTFESDDDELADNDDTSYNSDSESDRDEDRDSFRDICTIWAAIEDYYQCDPQFSDEDVSESDNSEMDIYDDMFLNNDSNPDSNEDP